MIFRVARKEFLETSRDGRFRISFAILAILLLTSLAVGWVSFREAAAQRQMAQAEDRRVWNSQGPRNPHSAAHFGRYLFKPVSPLTFVDQGLTPYLGVAAYVEGHTQTPARHRPTDDGGELARFGELTAASALQILVPLLIVLLSFGALAGEREQGTLRQLASLGVPPRNLLLGKAAGMTMAFLLLLVPVTLLGVAALLMNGSESAASTTRLLILAGGYLLYFAAFVFLSLAVSALAPSSRTALVLLLGFWTVNSFLLPRFSSDLADRLHPIPSTQSFYETVANDLKNGIDGHDSEDKHLAELKTALLAQYKVVKVEDLPVNFDAIAMQEGEEMGNTVLDRHYGRLWNQYQRQARVEQWMSVAAPLLAVRPYSMAMAGTDLATHRAFTGTAEQYRRVFIRFLNNYMRDHSKTGEWNWKADVSFWATAPDFQYSPPTLADLLPGQTGNLLILAGWCAVTFAFALWAVRHMRIEAQ